MNLQKVPKKKPLQSFIYMPYKGLCGCTPAKIRTWNRLIRSQVLYPVELRVHFRVQGPGYREQVAG
jgi:hypothetical protein